MPFVYRMYASRVSITAQHFFSPVFLESSTIENQYDLSWQ